MAVSNTAVNLTGLVMVSLQLPSTTPLIGVMQREVGKQGVNFAE
jgi:hypothetical protein